MKRARFTERRIGERNVMPMRPPIPPPPIPSPAPRPPPSPPPACAHARPPRRFPAPWRVRGTPGGYAVQDASGFVVVHAYGNDRPKGRERQQHDQVGGPAHRGRARAVARAAEAGCRIIEIGREPILAPAAAAIASLRPSVAVIALFQPVFGCWISRSGPSTWPLSARSSLGKEAEPQQQADTERHEDEHIHQRRHL
jgi:hypothetical protein